MNRVFPRQAIARLQEILPGRSNLFRQHLTSSVAEKKDSFKAFSTLYERPNHERKAARGLPSLLLGLSHITPRRVEIGLRREIPLLPAVKTLELLHFHRLLYSASVWLFT